MSSINKVILIGHVGRDAELRYTTGGTAVCAVSVATSRGWKDQASGERQEETEWHRVVLFDRLAEVAGEYLKRGRLVYLEGRLKTRKWTGPDAVERYSTEVIVAEFQLLGPKPAARPEPALAGGVRDEGPDSGDIPF
jgi:single-strand DNA-binding protein